MTCNGTTVEYNGITIHDVLTDEVLQEIVYDKTNVDPIGIRVTVTITGYVHLAAQEVIGIKGTGTLASAMQGVQEMLLVPRRQFNMKIGDQSWLTCSPYAVERCSSYPAGINGSPTSSGEWDIENGPRPNLRVIGIVGEHSMKIKFGIVYCKSICQEPWAATMFKGLLHMRFWIVDDIDCTTWMLTRTYQGRLRFYGNSPVAEGMAAHQNLLARAFAIPPLQWGFQRRRISINEDPSGLEAEFQVVDQEVWAVAPAPAIDWEGHFEVTIPYGGVTCESECRVTLRGGKMTPKWHLLRLAMQILDAKLRLSAVPINYIPMVMSFTEPLHLNEVTGYARVKHLGETSTSAPLTLSVFAANATTWFKPFPATGPGSLNLTGLAPGTHAPYQFEHGFQGSSPDGATTIAWAPNSLVGLLLPALQVPCCPIWLTNNIQGYAPNPGYGGQVYPPEEGTQIAVAQSPNTGSPGNPVGSPTHRQWWYWNTRLTSRYQTWNGLGAFPRAQASTDSTKATVSVIRMHAPCQFRQVRLEFTRANHWPELPKPKESFMHGGIRHTLLDWKLAPNASSQGADSKSDIRSVAMLMNYVLDRPVDWENNESYPVGRLPNRELATGGTGTPGDDTVWQQLDTSVAAEIFVEPYNIIGVTP
jgi:hypothetical protein